MITITVFCVLTQHLLLNGDKYTLLVFVLLLSLLLFSFINPQAIRVTTRVPN